MECVNKLTTQKQRKKAAVCVHRLDLDPKETEYNVITCAPSNLDDHSNRTEVANYITVGQIVLPIFYGVNPSDVRHQTGTFEDAFAKHEEKYKDKPKKLKKVRRWRTALKKLANLAGWDSKDRGEAELIQDIVTVIRRKLHPATSEPALKHVHDVFLNFRGKDTRLNFLEHLHAALIQQGISTFRDDKDLDKGLPIAAQLFQAIDGSKVSVVIVSPDYASSEWCLNELVKILKCKNKSEHGKKYRSSKASAQNKEKARTPESRYEINKCKASLQNNEHILNHNKRKMVKLSLTVNNDGECASSVYTGGKTTEIETSDKSLFSSTGFKNPLRNACERMIELRVLVNYDGEWMNSTYLGGKTKGILISDDITYQGLVDRVFGVVGVDPQEYKLILKTKYESKLPTQPVEIANDDDLAFCIKENRAWDMSSRVTLCTTFQQRAFPYGGMESSDNSGMAQVDRVGDYHGYIHGVTPDPVHQQQPYYHHHHHHQQPYYRQMSTWQPYYEQYRPPYQQLQWAYQYFHPSYMQQQQPPNICWHHHQPHIYSASYQ